MVDVFIQKWCYVFIGTIGIATTGGVFLIAPAGSFPYKVLTLLGSPNLYLT